MRKVRKIPALPAGLALVVTAFLLAAGSVTGSVPSARASGLRSLTDYPVPGGYPWGTAFDSRGRVWVAMPGCDPSPSCPSSTPPGKLALFDPSTSRWVTVVSLPAGYGQPLFVAVDRTGEVWFTMPVTNSIGVYDPGTKTVKQWALPTASAGPWDIAIDSTGKIWFTEHYTNKIGVFDPVSHSFTEVATPATNSNPYGITVDSSNDIWFTENTDAVALIGEYTNAGILKEYKIRNTPTAGSGLTPHMITIAPHGSIWWSEGWVSAIGMLKRAAAQPGTNKGVKEYFYVPSCASCGSHTSGISADSKGNIWLDDSLQNTFGTFPVGGGTFSFYNSPSGGHPHDGLNVDSQNRVWFDEEFAGKLAEAIPSGSGSPSPTAGSAVAPKIVAAKPAGGSPGNGPLLIRHPAPLRGRRLGGQKVVLRDRTLVIKGVTVHRGTSGSKNLIGFHLIVRNTSGKAIRNQSSFFELLGPEGDIFGQQGKGPDRFYRAIGAHASRAGTIEFVIPAAAASSLYLLYRPEIAAETVLTRLKLG